MKPRKKPAAVVDRFYKLVEFEPHCATGGVTVSIVSPSGDIMMAHRLKPADVMRVADMLDELKAKILGALAEAKTKPKRKPRKT